MTTYLLMGGAMFAACILAGALVGWWQWFIPRHRLNVIFRACRRERCAANVARLPVAPDAGRRGVVAMVGDAA